MSVRFIVGRAGCGKTYRCLEAIRARLRECAGGVQDCVNLPTQEERQQAASVLGERQQVDAVLGKPQQVDAVLDVSHTVEARPAGSRSHTGQSHTSNKLLLIVPEQASFQMERTLIETMGRGLIETPGIAAFVRCEVLSFQRLAFRVFAETGADPRRGDQTIGGFGRLMAIRRLIRRERGNLRLLGAVADKPGLIGKVAGAIDELMREQVEPAALVEVGEKIGETDPLGAAKLADLARLYQAYLDYLIGDRIDPAQYLTLAAGRLDGCAWLAGAEVWVDGFAGFTRQEYHLLAEVAKRAASVEVTMLLEPDASAVEATQLPAMSFSLFGRAERTLVQVRKELRSRGVEIGDPVRLRGQEGARRFRGPELACLEERLFSDTPAIAEFKRKREESHAKAQRRKEDSCDGSLLSALAPLREHSPGDNDPGNLPSCDAIRVVELADRRAEVEAAIAEIQRLTRTGESPMRYRDIAVIVRDLAAYHDLIASAMRSRNIPCFVDRRQPTTHHPLVELVRGLLAMATDDCRCDSVRAVLKTGLLPIAVGDADLLENYLVAHGIEGRGRWADEWKYTRLFGHRSEDDVLRPWQKAALNKVNLLRQELLGYVGPWLEIAFGGQADGRAWATALFACLERLEVGQRLEQWAQTAGDDAQADVADMHRQVWLDFTELLDEFVKALGSEPMRVQEFRETLEAGLAEFNLGLAPATLDQVLVGAVERSRHPEVRAVLLLGFDEAHWPMRRSEDPLLGDAEREAMRRADAEIGPARSQRLLDERMLAYVALTRASERLWISFPRQECDGKPLQPSAFLPDVLQAVPGLRVERVADAEAGRSAGAVTCISQLGGRLAREFRDRPRLAAETTPERRAMFNGLYEAARTRVDWRHTLLRSLGGLRYTNEAVLVSGMIERVLPSPFVASVSRLERFAACPFSHFAEYLLGLSQRVEAQTSHVDLGQVCHAILEKMVMELADEKKRLADLEDDDINERVDRIAHSTLHALAADLVLDDARGGFMLDRSREHLARVMRWQRDFSRRGLFRSAAAEFPFGYRRRPEAVVRLRTPKGRDILLRGKIDRVDVAELADDMLGLVIDYKRSGERKLSLAHVYHGLSLQLVGYLLALRQVGRSLAGREVRPVAALYLPLLEPYQTVGHPEDTKTKTYKCHGIIDASAIGAIDDSVQPGLGSSQYVSAALTREGKCYKNSNLAEREELAAMMSHVERRMGELADRLIDGEVKVSPYRINRQMPCGYCPFMAVCRYEIEAQYPQALEGMKPRDALQRMVEEAEECPGACS